MKLQVIYLDARQQYLMESIYIAYQWKIILISVQWNWCTNHQKANSELFGLHQILFFLIATPK